MNFPQNVVNNPIVTQQPALLGHQQPFSPQSQWENNDYSAYQLPLQLSQYYNVFPEVPSTKTSWTFPNGCVTSNIVRFTGTPTPSYPNAPCLQTEEYKASGIIPVKRKSLTNDEVPQPSKIFITEEKMAARMSGMHISNNFVSHSAHQFSPLQNETEIDEELPDSTTLNNNAEPQLVVCDELKNLNTDLNTFIPSSLIPLEKPSTALVLWRPPVAYLNVVKMPPEEEEYSSGSSVIITDITDRPDLDNNNISTVDLNAIINSPAESPQDSMEVMEI